MLRSEMIWIDVVHSCICISMRQMLMWVGKVNDESLLRKVNDSWSNDKALSAVLMIDLLKSKMLCVKENE